jgi:2-desacetyl-2-hydroxyethyl bacteriochlorophyllide A dehydrogenase
LTEFLYGLIITDTGRYGMLAVKLTGKGGLELKNTDKPEARDGVVLVRVSAAGICGTDVNELYLSELAHEKTPGHEVVGVVEEPGPSCGDFRAGDRVLVNCHVTCGNCRYCVSGDLIFCPSLEAIGFEWDGGLAEYLLVPAASLRHLPDDISDEEGVLLTDALATSYSAVKKTGCAPGDRVIVFGAGPIGAVAVYCAARLGLEVTAVDINEDRLKRAAALGASRTVKSSPPSIVRELLDQNGGEGYDAVLQCSGVRQSVWDGLKALVNRGTFVNVGIINDVPVNIYDDITMRELRLAGSRNCNSNMLPEMIDFCRAHRDIREIVTHHFALKDAAEAFKTAVRGEGLKIVINP